MPRRRLEGSVERSDRGGTLQSGTGPAVTVHVEAVSYRSAAWRELWRQIFIAVAEELDGLDDSAEEKQRTQQSDENGFPE